jgi:hypothetical protein
MFPGIADLYEDDRYLSGGVVQAPCLPSLRGYLTSACPSLPGVASAYGEAGLTPEDSGMPGFVYCFPDHSVSFLGSAGGARSFVSNILRDRPEICQLISKAVGRVVPAEDVAYVGQHSDAPFRCAASFVYATSGTDSEPVIDRAIEILNDGAPLPRAFVRLVIAVGTGHTYSVRHLNPGAIAAMDKAEYAHARRILNASDFGASHDLEPSDGGVIGVHAVRTDPVGQSASGYSIRAGPGTGDTFFVVLDVGDAESLRAPAVSFV